MEPGAWNEGRHELQQFQRGHDEMGGAIAVQGFQLDHNLAGRGAAQAFVAEGGVRDVTTQAFEFLLLLGATRCVGSPVGKSCVTQN